MKHFLRVGCDRSVRSVFLILALICSIAPLANAATAATLDREVAEKAFELTIKTWAENGISSDQALQAGIEESLKVTNSKQTVPISRVADFTIAREVYRELKAK